MRSEDWYEVVRRVMDSTAKDWEVLERELTAWLENKHRREVADAFAEHACALGFQRASEALAMAGV